MANAIAWNLLHQLPSKNTHPSSVQHVGVVAGGDHGDVAFQFGAAILVEISEGITIDFEVSVIELICRKDTAKLIKATILPGLKSRKWRHCLSTSTTTIATAKSTASSAKQVPYSLHNI